MWRFGKQKDSTPPSPRGDADHLLRQRVVQLHGPLDDEQATVVIAKLLFLQHENRCLPITLVIDSPGGSVSAGMAIVDAMRDLAPPVRTRCEGNAHGMAAVILAAGQPGERVVAGGSYLSLTPPFYPERRTATEAESDRELLAHRDVLAAVVAASSGREVNSIAADLSAGRCFDAAAAVEYGLADRVVE